MEKTIIRGTRVLYGEHSIRVRVIRSNSDICPYPLYIVTLQNDSEAPIAVRYSLREEGSAWDYSYTLTDVFANSYDDNVRIIRKEKEDRVCFLVGSKLLGIDRLYKLDTVDGTTEGNIYCSLLTCQIPEENYTNCDNEYSYSELCYQMY